MKKFTDQDATDLVQAVVDLAKTTATDEGGVKPVAICCMVSQPDVMAVPTVSRRMDGVKALSATTALHIAFTVLAYGADSIKHANKLKDGSWSEVDMLFRQTTAPMFCPWDGGIVVMGKEGNLLCALAAAGRTSEGNRRLMVLAAHKMGYKTNFDEKGEPLPSK
ncbi:MAG TPA: heme-binding protein [Candidatus Saccharimonadales bacterium]|nr:heme-binding protein [Candidatus Saccharimonadales bacterium]